MSPQMASLMSWFMDAVGGRQSARTLHFVVMSLFVLFALVHVVMVVYAGPINEMRSMITGRFRVRYPGGAEPRNETDTAAVQGSITSTTQSESVDTSEESTQFESTSTESANAEVKS